MANRPAKSRKASKSARPRKPAARTSKTRRANSRNREHKRKPQARQISAARLERALRVFSESKDTAAAARSIRVSKKRFLAAAKRHSALKKQKSGWRIASRVKRTVPIVSDGRLLAITASSKTASLVGRYNSAIGKFLETNNREFLAEFSGQSVADVNGKKYLLETEPNALYRLTNAGEPFESIYRIVI